jgi:hypothetical protein
MPASAFMRASQGISADYGESGTKTNRPAEFSSRNAAYKKSTFAANVSVKKGKAREGIRLPVLNTVNYGISRIELR